MKNILITGANRGLGLEFTKQYLELNNTVFATCRNPSNSLELNELKEKFNSQIQIIEMDVSNEESIKNGIANVEQNCSKLDILINNAGTSRESEKGLQTLDMKTMLQIFSVNTIAPVLIAKYSTTLLSKSEKPIIANLFSGLGFLSLNDYSGNGQYSYSASKAALNMCIMQMAVDLKPLNICVIGIGPGFVLTDLTKNAVPPPPLMPNESIKNMIEIIESSNIEDTGKFIENDKSIINY